MKRPRSVAIAGVVLSLICCYGTRRAEPPDPRRYAVDVSAIGYGERDLEQALLPRYRVRLPCDVQGLRYGNWEDMRATGALFLRFATSGDCLGGFLRGHGLRAVGRVDPVSWPGVLSVPDLYGWVIPAGSPAYRAVRAGRVRLDVAVVPGTASVTVYVVASR